MPRLTGHIDKQRFRFLPPNSWELEIEGWVLDPNQPIVELELFFDTQKVRVTRQLRYDLPAMLTHIPHALEGGFSASVVVPYVEDLIHQLGFRARLQSGQIVTSTVALNLGQVRFEGEVRADSRDLYGSESDRRDFRAEAEQEFAAFIHSEDRLRFAESADPAVSLIIVTFNQAALTYSCLRSLIRSSAANFELIIIDNASQDLSHELFSRLSGVRVVKNSVNSHFIKAANQGALLARAELILFVNNDTELDTGALANACKVMSENSKVGVLGGKIKRPDGLLQEAGCYVLRDGSTFGFGVSDKAESARYDTERAVDYCSGAFLMTRQTLFRRLGGFDAALAPAYFEDVDYCIRAQQLGFEVRYEPTVQLVHAEKSSAQSAAAAEELTRRNRLLIRKKHRDFLLQKPFPPIRPKLDRVSSKIVVIDNAYPDAAQGQGFPRAAALFKEILDLNWEVVFLALNQPNAPHQSSIAPGVHYFSVGDDLDLENKLTLHVLEAKVILISRSPNMERFAALWDFIPTASPMTKIIFDAEALFASRAILEAQILDGLNLTSEEQRDIIGKEVELAKCADAVLAVSQREAKVFLEHGAKEVSVLSHVVNVREMVPGPELRQGLLMVGPILDTRTPNADGFRWLVGEVFPKLLRLCPELRFNHAGRFEVSELARLLSEKVHSLGLVPDLRPLYDSHRVFVAPMRFGAGIPLKIVEAAAHGLPVVTTSLLAEQLGWSDETELLVADTPDQFCAACLRLLDEKELWLKISENARLRVSREYGHEQFHLRFRELLKVLNILLK